MFDFIGDIHGHADTLKALLKKLGYEKVNSHYAHPTRKAFFVGDYIDRGPKILETLEIVKAMVDNDTAIALMGNHEYNALCFHFQETEGGHLRKHLIKNIIQHYETLRQFQNRQDEYEDYLEWFKTLPLFVETDTCRAVHACWDVEAITLLKDYMPDGCMNDALIYESVKSDTPFHDAIEISLKGREMVMPDHLYFEDKDKNKRTEFRVKWWEDPFSNTYRQLSVEPIETLPDKQVKYSSYQPYSEHDKPVFFGHYWLSGKPGLFRSNICCLDYSVAKNGLLAAYRHDGEQVLSNDKWVHV
jgi:hypothetical protein